MKFNFTAITFPSSGDYQRQAVMRYSTALLLLFLAMFGFGPVQARVAHEWGVYDYFDCDSYIFPCLGDDPFYEDRCWHKLAQYGEKHTRRGEYVLEIGQIKPLPGEPYDAFRDRVMNTLTMQNYNQRMLKKSIKETEMGIQELTAQLSEVQGVHSELKKSLDMMKRGEKVRVRTHKPPFEVYTVKPGDTLQSIAYNKYGTNTAWLTIFRFNGDVLSQGPNLVEVGDVLWLPNIRNAQSR